VAVCCEHGNGQSASLKGGEFVDQLSYCQFHKKDSAAWNESVPLKTDCRDMGQVFLPRCQCFVLCITASLVRCFGSEESTKKRDILRQNKK
jgi:hypothetical protein